MIALVQGTDGERTLPDLAGSVRPASDREWRALLDRPGTEDSADAEALGATVIYAFGDSPGGTWELYDEAGELCMSATAGDSGAAVCGDPRVYVAPIDPDHVPDHVTLYDADDRVVGTLAVDG